MLALHTTCEAVNSDKTTMVWGYSDFSMNFLSQCGRKVLWWLERWETVNICVVGHLVAREVSDGWLGSPWSRWSLLAGPGRSSPRVSCLVSGRPCQSGHRANFANPRLAETTETTGQIGAGIENTPPAQHSPAQLSSAITENWRITINLLHS